MAKLMDSFDDESCRSTSLNLSVVLADSWSDSMLMAHIILV